MMNVSIAFTDLAAALAALAAGLLVLTGGYLSGVRRGRAAREGLRQIVAQQREALNSAQRELTANIHARESGLRALIEEAIAPLVAREEIVYDLATPEGTRNLTLLLDKIAEAGEFSGVALSDSAGLAIAASSNVQDADQLAVDASCIQIMADRLSAADRPDVNSVLLRDGDGQTTLFRFFKVHGQKLTLTATSPGSGLTATSLDATLAKVSKMLAAA